MVNIHPLGIFVEATDTHGRYQTLTPLFYQHGALIWVFKFFSAIEITVIFQVYVTCIYWSLTWKAARSRRLAHCVCDDHGRILFGFVSACVV